MFKVNTKIKEDGTVLTKITKEDGSYKIIEDVSARRENGLSTMTEALYGTQKLNEDSFEDEMFGDETELNQYGYEDEFYFNSQTIFISNKTSIPAAVGSRCSPVKLDLTKDEILNLIREKIEPLAGKALNVAEKIEVLDFLMKYKARISKVDFRLFETACATYDARRSIPLGDREDWQHKVYMLIRAMPQGQKGVL